jgi:hypothetical protein
VVAALPVAPVSAATKSFNGYLGDAQSNVAGGFFSAPRDVATYTAGTPQAEDDKIFVVEGFNGGGRVQRLDRNGNFERLWGADVVRTGFAGNTGTGFEICRAQVSGAGGCKNGVAGNALEGELNRPTGIAVNQSSGHVYVMDTGNRRVQEFDLEGSFVRAWGWGVDTGAPAYEICTQDCHPGLSNPSLPSDNDNPGQFASVSGFGNAVVVDPSPAGDVFATDAGNRRILQFASDGTFIRAWGFDISPGGSPAFETCDATPPGCQTGATPGDANGQFAIGHPAHIAIDADGIVYASDSAPGGRVIRFDSDPLAPSPLLDPLPASGALGDGQTTGLEVDPTSGDLLVVRDRSIDGIVTLTDVREIADPGSDFAPGPPDPTLVDNHTFADDADNAAGTGTQSLGFDAVNGNIYLAMGALFATSTPSGKFTGCTSGDSICTGLAVLATSTGGLAAELGAPLDVGSSSLSMSGTVNPAGGVAGYQFQMSSDGENWVDGAPPRRVAGSTEQDVVVDIDDLEPATLYRLRLRVSKQTGISETETVTSAETVVLTDATAPAVTTLGSAARTETSARLRGLVDPQGSSTSYRFEYGLAGGSFDHQVPVHSAQAGDGNSPQRVAYDLKGLQPGTAYHYRVVATNFVGTSVGDSVTFATKPSTPAPDPPPGRAYELVSPAEKPAGVGVGVWYHGPSVNSHIGVPAYEGERFAVQGTFGATLTDGQYNYANDWSLAERTPQGWVNKPLITRRAHGSQTLTFMRMLAATPDLSMTGWTSSTAKLFAEMEDWTKEVSGPATYLRDWSAGSWELFGPTTETQSNPLGLGNMSAAADGRSVLADGALRGLAGPLDPTLDLSPNVISVFLHEVPDGLSDTFPGDGLRSVVNVCSDGTEIPSVVDLGGGVLKQGAQPCPAPDTGRDGTLIADERGAGLGNVRKGIISDDGSRMFFMAPGPSTTTPCSGTGLGTACPAQLFVRQRNSNGTATTRWISRTQVTPANGASEAQDASLMAPVHFEGASRDGDKVFFRTTSPLTADDRNGQGEAPPAGGVVTGVSDPGSWDLYMYDLPDGADADPAGGELTRISAGPTGGSDCNSPLGGGAGSTALRFVSEDGGRLYFTCAAPLDGVPVPNDGTITSPGGDPLDESASNLYLYESSKPSPERWRFVARLPRTSELGGCATTGGSVGLPLNANNEQDRDLHVSANANCVQGTDDGRLVTFWTDGQLTDDDPDSVSGDVYAYDADDDVLTRASAPTTGSIGGAYLCAPGGSLAPCYGDGGIGTTGPLTKLGIAQHPVTSRRFAFFESRSRLLPSDQDDSYDVYQWSSGELTLLSTDTDDDVFFAGNDTAGTNVYLTTRERLSWQDRDAVLDVYSARLDGGIPQPDPTDETCEATTGQCQETGQTQPQSTIESGAVGNGNGPVVGRVRLSIGKLTARARRKAAKTGKVSLAVGASAPTTVVISAKWRRAGRMQKAANDVRRALRGNVPERTVVTLNRGARRHLRQGRSMRLTVTVRASSARAILAIMTLKR